MFAHHVSFRNIYIFFLVFSKTHLSESPSQSLLAEARRIAGPSLLARRRDVSWAQTGPTDSLENIGTILTLMSIFLFGLHFRSSWFGLQCTAPCLVWKRINGILDGSSCFISGSLLVRTIWTCLVTMASYARYNLGTGKKCITYD